MRHTSNTSLFLIALLVVALAALLATQGTLYLSHTDFLDWIHGLPIP